MKKAVKIIAVISFILVLCIIAMNFTSYPQRLVNGIVDFEVDN